MTSSKQTGSAFQLAFGVVAAAAISCATNNADDSNSNGALTAPSDSSSVSASTSSGPTSTPATTTSMATGMPSATTTNSPSATTSAAETTPPGAGGTADSPTTATPTASDSAASGGSPSGSATQTNDAGAAPSETSAGGTGSSDSTTTENTDAGTVGTEPTARPLDVTAEPGRHEHRFRAKDADAEVSFNDNDQIAIFDNRAATLLGKLVLTFGGAGETKGNLTGGGEFCAKRGFHVLAVAAFQDYNIVDSGPDFFGDARRTVFEGVMHTQGDAFANIELTPADGVARRTQKALEYLQEMNPEEDWGYYLQDDGSVRWSDVIFTGVSHGASNSARFAFLVEASRVVSIAGPRDNLCTRVDVNDCGGTVATWFSETSKTPMDRFYAVTGVGDDQHTQHLFTMEKLGYVGEATRIDSAQPPYGDSHRLVHGGGHDDVCAQQSFQAACNYVFGVPSENHAGTGP